MQIIFTIYGGPHDGYEISSSYPMSHVNMEDHSKAHDLCDSPSYWPVPLNIIRYDKKRIFIKKYGRIFLRDIYAISEHSAHTALRELQRFFNPIYKK
ncbi:MULTISPECIES: hypothetical protein [Acinetobacter]|uniref:hypothetical protein n=1 Tax=Acinetobacter TaxID=469 RepID=UPI001F4B3B75|nr:MULTISPECIES: hypothetical protein [Acinetobacter]MCH7380377.1 hypothetical protein [Acinetobacter higginsii]